MNIDQFHVIDENKFHLTLGKIDKQFSFLKESSAKADICTSFASFCPFSNDQNKEKNLYLSPSMKPSGIIITNCVEMYLIVSKKI